jgi:hypothetical protein
MEIKLHVTSNGCTLKDTCTCTIGTSCNQNYYTASVIKSCNCVSLLKKEGQLYQRCTFLYTYFICFFLS